MGRKKGNEEKEEKERKTISRLVPQTQASMTLYLSSSWAEQEMKGLQEDKNVGKGKTRDGEKVGAENREM